MDEEPRIFRDVALEHFTTVGGQDNMSNLDT